MQKQINEIPQNYREDIARAVKILKDAECKEVFLFGSLAEGQVREGSDIDLAVRGCPSGMFFRVLGKLLLELDHPVDLVDLDREDDFAKYLKREGALVRVS